MTGCHTATVNVSPTGFLTQLNSSLPLRSSQDHLWHHPFYKRILGPLPGNLDSHGTLLRNVIVKDSLSLATDSSHNPSIGLGSHGWVFALRSKLIWHGQGHFIPPTEQS